MPTTPRALEGACPVCDVEMKLKKHVPVIAKLVHVTLSYKENIKSYAHTFCAPFEKLFSIFSFRKRYHIQKNLRFSGPTAYTGVHFGYCEKICTINRKINDSDILALVFTINV